MISDRDLNEALKAALMGRETEYTPSAESIAAEKARLGALADGGVDMPPGTKVNFAPDAGVPASGAERMPIVPKVVDLTSQPPDDLEMAYARQQDREARAREAFERGARELVAGITRTQPASTFQQPKDAVDRLLALRKGRSEDAQRNEGNRLNAAKFNFERSEAARREAEAKAKDERDFAYRQQHDAATLEQQGKNAEATRALAGANLGLRVDEATRKKKEEAEKVGASDIPLFGGTLKLRPGLTDTERGQARAKAGDWEAADAAVGNFQSELENYARSPSVENKGKVTAALRTASSAFNSAIGGGAMSADEARAMSEAMGADILSPTGLAALGQSIFGGDPAKAAATISSRVRAARAANKAAALGKLRGSGDFVEGGQRQQTQTSQTAGKVTVSNGNETLIIDAADLDAARRDGFDVVSK